MITTPETLHPGQITLPLQELANFETNHAHEIVAGIHELTLPEPNEKMDLVGGIFSFHDWAARQPLARLMQPKDFVGPLANVVLTPLESPYDMLLTSKERGVVRSNEGKRFAVKQQHNQVNEHILRALTVGFALDYTVQVRGQGGHAVRSEVYLAPVPFRFSTNETGRIKYQQQLIESYGGLAVARVVMQPAVSDSAYKFQAQAYTGVGSRSSGVRTANVPRSYADRGRS
ncbi:MAG: hypothetical protein JWO41_943 [Candidatus Saccharibacteria bacterium]|nr:hypothetical protein [Candidatus Saccharibacteria bacterium]